jgi:hypothetical protein
MEVNIKKNEWWKGTCRQHTTKATDWHKASTRTNGDRVLGLRFRAFAGFMYATSKQIETNGQEACNDGQVRYLLAGVT